jgi:hypothetical protein
LDAFPPIFSVFYSSLVWLEVLKAIGLAVGPLFVGSPPILDALPPIFIVLKDEDVLAVLKPIDLPPGAATPGSFSSSI